MCATVITSYKSATLCLIGSPKQLVSFLSLAKAISPGLAGFEILQGIKIAFARTCRLFHLVLPPPLSLPWQRGCKRKTVVTLEVNEMRIAKMSVAGCISSLRASFTFTLASQGDQGPMLWIFEIISRKTTAIFCENLIKRQSFCRKL
jgi:hypothetical protein